MGRSANRNDRVGESNAQNSAEHDEHPRMQLTERIIYLSGEVNEQSIAQTIAGIVKLANQDRSAPITLMVSTYGGSVDEMFSLYDVVKYVPCPIHTVGLGKVMSAGVLLLASGKKGCRMVGKSARLMIHPISGETEGNVFQFQNELQEFQRQQKLMEDLLLKETTMSRAQLTKLMKSGCDNYITARDALKYGLVDSIIEPRENK